MCRTKEPKTGIGTNGSYVPPLLCSRAACFYCSAHCGFRFAPASVSAQPLLRWGMGTFLFPKVHRCGNAFCGFRQKTAKCAAASKPPRFICPRQRLRRFPSAPRCGGGSARHSVGADSIRPRAAGCRPYGSAGQQAYRWEEISPTRNDRACHPLPYFCSRTESNSDLSQN